MPRDYREMLRPVPCWDAAVDARWFERSPTGAVQPLPAAVLQKREELIAFCEWIETNDIKSYLEIGIWTGDLLCLLQALFRFERIAACDVGIAASWGHPIRLPQGTLAFAGDSHSPAFLEWRRQLGPIDLVLIDGDHSYEGVKRDFEINRRFPHRFLALHDIANPEPSACGVKQFWQELKGHKLEIVRPDPTLRAQMGIGIWWE